MPIREQIRSHQHGHAGLRRRLDTVAALLSFVMRSVAKNPELQRRLQRDPAIIPDAVEELLRRHDVSASSRLIATEFTRKGAHFMPGDMAMTPTIITGLDDRRYPDPMRIDFDRPIVPQTAFGYGPHMRVGQHLARMELRIFLEEWFSRMPEVRVDPDLPPMTEAGPVAKMTRLDLVWEGAR